MFCSMRNYYRVPLVLVASLFLFSTFDSAFAENSVIGAKAVFVQGTVHVIHKGDKHRVRVRLGKVIKEGDRIITSRTGVLEIRFDNNDLIRIDRNTNMVVNSLYRENDGSTFSVFNLLFGRVKSAVSKLASSRSKFEYHTKAAIAGVAGTPPFVVAYEKGKMEVDLLGKEGEHGAVFVKGFDPNETLVTVLSNTRTTVTFGSPPLKPFPVSLQRLRRLQRAMPFKTKTGGGEQEKSEPGKSLSGGEDEDEGEEEKNENEAQEETSSDEQPEEDKSDSEEPAEGGAGDDSGEPSGSNETSGASSATTGVALDMASQTVTTTVKPSPEDASSLQGINSQTSSEQGTVGEVGGGGEPPAAAIYKIEITYR